MEKFHIVNVPPPPGKSSSSKNSALPLHLLICLTRGPSVRELRINDTLTRWILAAALAAVMLTVTTRDNTFPFQYHNDEPSKTDQIYENRRNFLHPPLMLDAAALVSAALGTNDNRQEIAVTGRWLSAMYATIAVVAFSAWIGLLAGRAAMIAAGVILLMDPRLHEIAHYFKEDTLFLAGISLALLTGAWCARAPSYFSAAACGVALGVLGGSKFIGFPMALLFAGLVIYRLRSQRRWMRWVVVAFLCTLVLVYWSLLWQFPAALAGIREELGHMRHGHYGVGMPVPHLNYPGVLFLAYPSMVFWVVCAGACWIAWKSRREDPDFLLYLVISAATVVVLCFLPKFSERYLLPVHLAITGAIAVMCGRLFGLQARFHACKVVAVFGLVLLSVYTLPARMKIQAGFSADSRAELVGFLRGNLPPQSTIAIDAMVNPREAAARLPSTGFPFAIRESFFAADLGTVEELRGQGIEYFAGSWDVHHRYIEGASRSSDDALTTARREFYNRLYEEGEILWRVPGRHPKPLHPGLVLIRLPAAP